MARRVLAQEHFGAPAVQFRTVMCYALPGHGNQCSSSHPCLRMCLSTPLHHTTPQHSRDTQAPRHPGSRALRAQDTAKGSRVCFLPCFTAPIVTIISNNIPVLFFIEPCLTFWKTCNTWVVLLGKCCLSGTSIWDKRGWWGLQERAQPCPHAPASGEPRWPQPTEHSSCSETEAPGGIRGCPAVP